METKITYVLYGVAKRSRRETVCQFFATIEELEAFRTELPGSYNVATINVDHDGLVFEPVVEPDPKAIAKAEAQALKAQADADRAAFVERLRSLVGTTEATA